MAGMLTHYERTGSKSMTALCLIINIIADNLKG